PTYYPTMPKTPHLTSESAACCWMPLFALRSELARRPELASHPVALVAPDTARTPRVWQVVPLARHAGVKPGMAVSQAISPCSAFRVPRFAFRVGWGRGKFVSWVAATRAKPGAAVIVPVGGEAKFLASQPLAVLPLDPDTHRRLQQLGVKTLGALVALPEEAVVSQFGGPGRRLWRLAAGLVSEPVVGRVVPEPIVAALTFFTPVGERDLLAHALDKLVDRALGDPRRS